MACSTESVKAELCLLSLSWTGPADANLVPTSVFQNGEKCILVNVGGAAFPSSPSDGGTSTEAAEKPIRLSGPNIIGVDGNALAMKGINWFGFDVGFCLLFYSSFTELLPICLAAHAGLVLLSRHPTAWNGPYLSCS